MIFYFLLKEMYSHHKTFTTYCKKDLMGSVLLTYFQQQDKYIELLFKRQNHYVLSDKIKKEFLLLISENVNPTRRFMKNRNPVRISDFCSVRCH